MLTRNVKNKDIDFLQAYQKTESVSFKGFSHVKVAIIPLSLILLFGGSFGYLKYQEHTLRNKIDTVQAKIDALHVKQKEENSETKYKTLQEIQQEVTYLTEISKKRMSYPTLNKEMLNTIISLSSGMEINTLQFEETTGHLTMTIKAKSVSQTNEFIRKLRATNDYKDILYSGYQEREENTTTSIISGTTSSQQQTQVAKTYYMLTVTCVIAGVAVS